MPSNPPTVPDSKPSRGDDEDKKKIKEDEMRSPSNRKSHNSSRESRSHAGSSRRSRSSRGSSSRGSHRRSSSHQHSSEMSSPSKERRRSSHRHSSKSPKRSSTTSSTKTADDSTKTTDDSKTTEKQQLRLAAAGDASGVGSPGVYSVKDGSSSSRIKNAKESDGKEKRRDRGIPALAPGAVASDGNARASSKSSSKKTRGRSGKGDTRPGAEGAGYEDIRSRKEARQSANSRKSSVVAAASGVSHDETPVALEATTAPDIESIAEAARQRGIQQGIQQGRQQGRREQPKGQVVVAERVRCSNKKQVLWTAFCFLFLLAGGITAGVLVGRKDGNTISSNPDTYTLTDEECLDISFGTVPSSKNETNTTAVGVDLGFAVPETIDIDRLKIELEAKMQLDVLPALVGCGADNKPINVNIIAVILNDLEVGNPVPCKQDFNEDGSCSRVSFDLKVYGNDANESNEALIKLIQDFFQDEGLLDLLDLRSPVEKVYVNTVVDIIPSKAPSPSSTDPVSSSPTSATTAEPSQLPTGIPSADPTKAPVAWPTTAEPTKGPTPIPSTTPSKTPTAAPTVSSSSSPTAAPVVFPTTAEPTKTPSSEPSQAPSTQPSRAPSAQPSPSTPWPSSQPSVRPSSQPTSSPTPIPCFQTSEELKGAVDYWFTSSASKETIEGTYGAMADWCFGPGVTDMSDLFRGRATFDEPIGNWDVSKVTNMLRMFREATSFDQDLSSWNVSSVTNMQSMFNGATAFNQDLSSWSVGSVTRMDGMFAYASAFDQDLSSWQVGSVSNMHMMFAEATAFNQDLSSWDVSKVDDMVWVFKKATSFRQNLCAWGPKIPNTANVGEMFRDASSCPNPSWTPDLNAATPGPFCYSCIPCFQTSEELKEAVDNWYYVSQETVEGTYGAMADWCFGPGVTDMSDLFRVRATFDEPIGNWDVSGVTTMEGMFWGAKAFNQDIGSWNVGSVTTMRQMFESAYEFNQDLSSWDVSKVTNMFGMFVHAKSFDQDLSRWNVSSVTTLQQMFWGAIAFDGDLSSWDVSSVTNMWGMFNGASSFKQNLCAWGPKMPNTAIVDWMFDNTSCPDQSNNGWPNLNANPPGPFCHTC